jgi:hypothetical protein
MPEFFDKVLEGLPVKDIVHPFGCLNFAAYMPKGSTPPDLGEQLSPAQRLSLTDDMAGPKMYCAYASGDQGSTRLHLDLSGAINILLWSSGDKQSEAAEWWIWSAEHVQGLRDYMRKTKSFKIKADEDPIHSQRHFLTQADMPAMKAGGIAPTVIKQKAGEAIFIPAHCPHQVRGFYLFGATESSSFVRLRTRRIASRWPWTSSPTSTSDDASRSRQSVAYSKRTATRKRMCFRSRVCFGTHTYISSSMVTSTCPPPWQRSGLP